MTVVLLRLDLTFEGGLSFDQDSRPPSADVEQIFQGGPQKVHHHHVVIASSQTERC